MSRFHSAEPVRVVCVDDPAIDEEATGKLAIAHYYAERDMTTLVFRDGATPAVFEIARLTSVQTAQIKRTTTSEDGRWELAFRYALVRATNVPCTDGLVRELIEPAHIKSPKPKQLPALTDAEYNLFGDDHISEIGMVAFKRSPLVPGKPLFFGLPPSSVVALERMELSSRLAAIRDLGTQGSERHSSESEKSTSPLSEQPGDATVTASPEKKKTR